jgi:hypothetical protein
VNKAVEHLTALRDKLAAVDDSYLDTQQDILEIAGTCSAPAATACRPRAIPSAWSSSSSSTASTRPQRPIFSTPFLAIPLSLTQAVQPRSPLPARRNENKIPVGASIMG